MTENKTKKERKTMHNKTYDKRALVKDDEQRLKELEKSLENLEAFVYLHPRPMWSKAYENNEEAEKTVSVTLSAMYKVLSNEKKRDTMIDRILSEVILGAYQDRMVAYTISPSGVSADSTEAMENIQRIRQKADMHLIRVIQTFKDIRRPPVKVIVKQADQVNVGDKQMNVDKQVNISSDLDKK